MRYEGEGEREVEGGRWKKGVRIEEGEMREDGGGVRLRCEERGMREKG